MKEIVKVLGGGPGRESGRNPAWSAGRLAGSGMNQNGAKLDLTKNLYICDDFYERNRNVFGGMSEKESGKNPTWVGWLASQDVE